MLERPALLLVARSTSWLERTSDKPWGMRELALLDINGNLIRAGQENSLG